MYSDWDQYFHDLYRTPVDQTLLSNMNWFYWSAPFPSESLRVALQKPASPRPNDAFIGMYSNLGFLVHRERNDYVHTVRNKYVEVLRCGSPVSKCHGMNRETHVCGMWYYNLRGSGVWLSLGKSKYAATREKHELELGVCQKGVRWSTHKFRKFDTVMAPWHRNTTFVVTVDMRNHNLSASDYDQHSSIACGGIRQDLTWLRYGSRAEWPCKCQEDSIYSNCGGSHARVQEYPRFNHTIAVRGTCDGKQFVLPCYTLCHNIVKRYCWEHECTQCFMVWPPPQTPWARGERETLS